MHTQLFSPRRSPVFRGLIPALAGLFLAAACADPQRPIAPEEPFLTSATDVETAFNPQPDPPGAGYRFSLDVDSLVADAGRRVWRGALLTNRRGIDSLFVQNLAQPVRRGATLHLHQSWNLPLDSITRGTVPMRGMLNLRNGHLVLEGRTAGGRGVHVMAAPVDSALSRRGPAWGTGLDSLMQGSHVGRIRLNP